MINVVFTFNKYKVKHVVALKWTSVKWTALRSPSPKLNKTTSSPKPSGPF